MIVISYALDGKNWKSEKKISLAWVNFLTQFVQTSSHLKWTLYIYIYVILDLHIYNLSRDACMLKYRRKYKRISIRLVIKLENDF